MTVPQPPGSTFTLAFEPPGGTMTLRIIQTANPDMSGTDVKSWQALLEERGYDVGDIDGFWGPKSNTALRKMQSDYGLRVDGIIGAQTGEKLIEGYPQV